MAEVARFRDLAGAEVASATLEAAGIANVLLDACVIGVAWHWSTALGGVRLEVVGGDLGEARDLLTVPAVVEWPADLPPGSADELCGACHSFALELESGPRKTLAVMTALSVPIWWWRSRLRCTVCGASQRVPLRFRPELVLAWLLAGIGLAFVMAILLWAFGYAIYGRRA